MDTRTGKIISAEDFARLEPSERQHFIPAEPTRRQRNEGRIRRNDPCPCGSGRKFKLCCYQPGPPQDTYAALADKVAALKVPPADVAL